MTAEGPTCLILVNECGGAKLFKDLASRNVRSESTHKHAEAQNSGAGKPRSGRENSVPSPVRSVSAGLVGAALTAGISACVEAPIASAQVADPAQLIIENYVGMVEVVRSDSGRIELSERSAGRSGDLDIEASADGLQLKVSGAEAASGLNCTKQNGAVRVQRGGAESRAIESFPDLVIAVPNETQIQVQVIAGAISVNSGLRLDGKFQGCAEVNIGASTEQLKLVTSGSVAMNVARANTLELIAQGGSRIQIGEIVETGTIELAGASRVEIAETGGALSVNQDGASRVTVASGETSNLALAMSGAARFEHHGDIDKADIDLARAARASLASLDELKSVSLARAAKLQIANERVEG